MKRIERNPWDIPEWHSIGREADLVCHLIGSGATALGRANYADRVGEYYTAFFGLSIGFERLMKLILVADYAIANEGKMPVEQVIRKFGHNLLELSKAADEVSKRHGLKLVYARPTSEISSKIIECLDDFADANRGRYANFGALGDPNLGSEEPIKKWWSNVAEAVLRENYYGKSVQQQVEGRAKAADTLLSPLTMVRHINETGDAMQDVYSSSVRTGQSEIVQRYGRYHALTLARWLADIFGKLSTLACYTHNIGAFFGASEHFQSYTVDDSFLKTRKRWPLS